jgi:isoprenylcysteine carboxyl methyltransferase (ICMT) family protein YpbQ
MTEKYSIYIISSFEYNVSVLVNILKHPNYRETYFDKIHTEFSNYLDL